VVDLFISVQNVDWQDVETQETDKNVLITSQKIVEELVEIVEVS
jgi:hypothetical protein